MRTGYLVRHADPSGVSGTGVVAELIVWSDDSCSVRWLGERPSLVYWRSLDDALAIHGHGGKTTVQWATTAVL